MGTEVNTATAVNAHVYSTARFLEYGIYRAGVNAVTAVNAQFFLYDYAAAFAMGKSPGGAGVGTGCRVAGEAVGRRKTGGQSAR